MRDNVKTHEMTSTQLFILTQQVCQWWNAVFIQSDRFFNILNVSHGGTHGAGENHKDYIENTLPKSSPIKIPSSATVKEEQKNGYDQVKYTWKKGDYSYTSRWHTRTPNAPKEQGNSWVVERKKSGVGCGKNARPKQEEVLVGKNKWISKQDWKNAIMARKKGTLTQQQKEWLDNGHWKDNR